MILNGLLFLWDDDHVDIALKILLSYRSIMCSLLKKYRALSCYMQGHFY